MADKDIEIKGIEDILKKMEHLSARGADKVLCAMIRAQLTVIGRQMRADVDPRVKDGRRSVKARFKRNRKKNWVMAKVGFHVGKSKPKVKEVVRPKGRGVGISAQNIHWWVAGTKPRMTKTLTPNVSRGAMPKMQPLLAKLAHEKSRSLQIAAMVKFGAKRLEKELSIMQGTR